MLRIDDPGDFFVHVMTRAIIVVILEAAEPTIFGVWGGRF